MFPDPTRTGQTTQLDGQQFWVTTTRMNTDGSKAGWLQDVVKTEQNLCCTQQPLNWLKDSLYLPVNNRSIVYLQLRFSLAEIHEEMQKLLTAPLVVNISENTTTERAPLTHTWIPWTEGKKKNLPNLPPHCTIFEWFQQLLIWNQITSNLNAILVRMMESKWMHESIK